MIDGAGRVVRRERVTAVSDRISITTVGLTSGVYTIAIDELPNLKLRLVQP
ncbi:MAG: hypothetical protein IPK99_00095 [Flavobacteriales bacterium]|nr:hypothetical protein [Flavobacteriales bacterium]